MDDPMDDQGKRGDSTIDVLLDDVEEQSRVGSRREPTLDRLLGELEQEVQLRPSQPPALPRPSAPAASSARTMPPARPPPPPRAPVRPLGRPSPVPRPGPTTIPPITPPSSPRGAGGPDDDDDAENEDAVDPTRALAESWSAALEQATDPLRKGLLHYELARLHEGPLADPTKAAAHYQSAIASRPDHLPSLRAARRLALARGDHRAALPLFDAEARITADSRRKAALLYAKGRVLEDTLGQTREARELYATAAELDRASQSILIALEQRCRDDGERGQLGPILERLANAVTGDPRHRAALLVERGRLFEHGDKRVDAAMELYELALALDPQASGALDGVERLAAAHGRTRDRIRCLERRAAQSTDPSERSLALYGVARLHGPRLGNRDEAIAALERALAEQPDDPLVLEELAALYEQGGRLDPLIEVLTRMARASSDGGEQLAAWHRIGQIYDERLDRPALAQRAYERALALDPAHVPSLQALGRIYDGFGAWEALAAMHLAEAQAARDPHRRAAAHARVAEVLEQRSGNAEGAMAHHALALTLVPGYAPSFKALARLYAETQKHRELLELHERAVELAASAPETASREASPRGAALGKKPAARPGAIASRATRPGATERGTDGRSTEVRSVLAITHLFKIGALYEESLGEHAQAAHTYRRILSIEPGHLGALHALQRVTERAGRHGELVDALEREAALYADDARVVDLLSRAAEILDVALRDGEGAIARYRRVLELDPTYAPALTGLGRIYHRLGRWEDVLELYRREVELTIPERSARTGAAATDATPRASGAAALLHKMGLLCEERLGDETQALDCYRRAIQVDPTHRPSLRALARHLAARGQHAELVRVLELEMGGLRDPAARARAAFRLGEVHEELAQPDRAATAYETALAAAPGHPPAATALRRLRATQGAFRRLAEQLEEEARATPIETRATERWAQAGELWARALEDPRRAVGCYEHALELAPRHLEALLALERLYRALGRHDALARTYGTLARVLTDVGARVAALRELARIEARGTRNLDELREIHEAILSLSADDPGALEALESIAFERGDRALLMRVDERWIAKAGDAKTGDAKTVAAYRTRLAESLEASGDPAALDVFRAALESDAECLAAAKGLARVAERQGRPAAVAEAARHEAALAHDPRQAARLLVRAARLTETELRDPDAAVHDYERALELAPDDADAAAGCASLHVAAGRPDQAADRLARAAGSASTPERVAALWMEVARLQADLLDNLPGALTSLDRVLKSYPSHVPTLRRMAELYLRQARWQDAAQTLAQLVALAPDREVLKAAHLELARLWAERLADLPRALVSLQAVLALETDHPEALARLAEVAARTGDLERAATTLRRLVDSAPSPAARASALLRAAELHAARGDAQTAREAVLTALALEGPDGPAAERHRSMIEGAADWEAHAAQLGAWLRTHASDPRGRIATLEIARIYREELDRPAEAVEILEQRARQDPSDVETRRTLASTLKRAARSEEAVAELRSLLSENLARTELWRELAHLLRSLGDVDGARRALAPLILLGTAHGEEASEVQERRGRTARARAGSFGPALLEALYPMRRAGALLQLLQALGPVLGKVYPADFEAFGLSSRDRVGVRATEAIRPLADRLGAAFGLGEVHLYVHRVRTRGVEVELTVPPSILIPAGIAEQSPPHLAFALARAMANIAMGLSAVDKLTSRELEIVLAAAARRVAPGFGAGLTNEDILDDVGRQLYRALPRRNRKDVDDLARTFVASGERDFGAVREAVGASACRVALVLTDDLCASVDVLKRTERDLAELTGARLLLHPSVARLVRFWISADADALRQRAGLSEPTTAAPVRPTTPGA